MSLCDPHALTELFFDELPPEAAAALQRHAHACRACTQTLEGLRQDQERLRAPRGAMTSLEVLFRGVEARLAAQVPPRRSPRQLLPGLVPFTGGCLALLLALFALGSGGLPPSSAEGALAWASSSAGEATALACPVDANPADDDPWFDLSARSEAQMSACLIASPGRPVVHAEACF
jgi:hypothetical protein